MSKANHVLETSGRIVEEPDSEGLPSGVENEDRGELLDRPFDPNAIDVTTRNPTLGLLINRLKRQSLDLQPEYQRLAGVWSDERQSRLIESLLLRIPLPTFYAAEVNDDLWAMVDGVQRMTAISRFMSPESLGMDRLKLSGLQYLKFDGKSFEELPGSLQTRLEEAEVVLHLIRQGTPEDVKFNIFARINTGGMPLSGQEIRNALNGGRARTFLAELASMPSFLRATHNSVSSKRMADKEMVLRFCAFSASDPAGYSDTEDFDVFLSKEMKRLNSLPDRDLEKLRGDFDNAMVLAYDVFADQSFRKILPLHSKSPVNKALFEAMSVNLGNLDKNGADAIRRHKSSFYDGFLELQEEEEFWRSISYGTGSAKNVVRRFRSLEMLVDSVLGLE